MIEQMIVDIGKTYSLYGCNQNSQSRTHLVKIHIQGADWLIDRFFGNCKEEDGGGGGDDETEEDRRRTSVMAVEKTRIEQTTTVGEREKEKEIG